MFYAGLREFFEALRMVQVTDASKMKHIAKNGNINRKWQEAFKDVDLIRT